MENKDSKEGTGRKYNYFVDQEKFEAEDSTIMGALIRAKLPESKRGYSIFTEGRGNDPDILINDNDSVTLEKGEKHFYTVPPASFGA